MLSLESPMDLKEAFLSQVQRYDTQWELTD
jgi:hypothetical protein